MSTESTRRGIWRIRDVYEELLDNNWITSAGSYPANIPKQIIPYGYIVGANVDPLHSMSYIDFENDTTTASPRSTGWSENVHGVSAISGKGKGYFLFGNKEHFAEYLNPQFITTQTDISRNIYTFDFYSETLSLSTTAASDTQSRAFSGHTSDSTYGYICGGQSNNFNIDPFLNPLYLHTSSVDRISLSNGTFNSDVGGNFPVSVMGSCAVGNANYGWFAGGIAEFPSPAGGYNAVSYVSRLDYSNLTNFPIRTSLSSSKVGMSPSGTSDYGYFWGGSYENPVTPSNDDVLNPITSSALERIQFTNDTASTVTRAGAGKYASAGTGNLTYGYQAGGGDHTSTAGTSVVNRFSYSSDTSGTVTRGPLNESKHGCTGTSNSSWLLRV
jgi:hypothetical protein